ncbi:MAG: hypothetical protein K9L28_04070 [Synergistales bacterium]|nr:hypothetical protein [Synergistales bacterium]
MSKGERFSRKILEALRRLFMGGVTVRKLGECAERPDMIRRLGRSSVVNQLGIQSRSLGKKGLQIQQRSGVKGGRQEFPTFVPQVHGRPPGTFVPELHGEKALKSGRPVVHKAVGLLSRLPQRRQNRIHYLAGRPSFRNAVLLGIFSPVIRKAVTRSALNKEEGALHCWYDPYCSSWDSYHLLLLRKGGATPALSWQWLENRPRGRAGGGSSGR